MVIAPSINDVLAHVTGHELLLGASLVSAAAWTHPIGTRVLVRRDDGAETETTTRSEPWALGDGTPVVLLVGISGGYALDRVRVAGVVAALDMVCPCGATIDDPLSRLACFGRPPLCVDCAAKKALAELNAPTGGAS